MNLDLEPYSNKIFLKRREYESKSGIIIVSEKKISEGEVVAVGPECKHTNVGDIVIFGDYAGHDMERLIDGKKQQITLLFEDDIHAKIKACNKEE